MHSRPQGSRGPASWATSAASAVLLGMLAVSARPAAADVLLNETAVVTTGPAAVDQDLTVAQSESVDVNVTDLAFPAALTSIRVAVTQGGTLVQPGLTSAPGKITFAAVAGTTYTIRVLGQPNPASYSGSVNVNVTPTANPNSSLLSFVATFQLPGGTPGQSVVTENLTIPEAGDYTVTLYDDAFPAAFSGGSAPSLSAIVFLGGTPLTQAPIVPGQPTVLSNLSPTVAGAAAQYSVTIVANANPSVGSGLFGLRIVGGPSANVVFDQTLPVGSIAPATTVNNPQAQSLTLQVTDFAFPAPLSLVGAVLTQRGQPVSAAQVGSGSVTAAAPAGALQMWRVANAGTTAGSYQISVNAGSTTLYSDAEAVSAPASSGLPAYALPFTVPTSGAYTATVTDFQFPAALQGVQFAVAQNGAVLASDAQAGTVNFNAAAGPAALLVTAQAPTGGMGLLGLEVLSTGATQTTLLDSTQAVGGVFDQRQVTVVSAGQYNVTLTDGDWPAPFQTLALALTRSGTVVGKIYGGGTISVAVTPGTYLASFIATPSAAENAGLYSLEIQSSAPTATLSSNLPTIPSGQSVTLTWSSTSATACTASGGWSGSEAPAGGTQSVGPLSTTTTFTLTCTGPGGTSAPASVTVTVTAAPGGSHGGGALGIAGLLSLMAIGAGRTLRRRRS